MKTAVYDSLLSVRNERGGGFIVLVDPDKLSIDRLRTRIPIFESAGIDALFVGGSLMHASEVDQYVGELQEITTLPIIGFPGSVSQISPKLDAVLFLSVISGRNPDMLFGQHVHAAPMIRRFGLETIATGYMLVESGRLTSAQYMNHSLPLPRTKPQLAAATGLAAEMMGMKLLFADAGSGAEYSVTEEMIAAIVSASSLPLIVGGGLTAPEEVRSRVDAGASFIVVGTALESSVDPGRLEELVAAAHVTQPHAF